MQNPPVHPRRWSRLARMILVEPRVPEPESESESESESGSDSTSVEDQAAFITEWGIAKTLAYHTAANDEWMMP